MLKQYDTIMKKFISPYVYIGCHCNNNCIFCSEANNNAESFNFRPLEDIKNDILKIKGSYDFINFMGKFKVTDTGIKTRFGSIAQTLTEVKEEKTPLELSLSKLIIFGRSACWEGK